MADQRIQQTDSWESRLESVYDRYFDMLLAGDRNRCSQLVSGFLAEGIPIRILYEHLFQRSLYQVGELWEHNRISVAREHLATSVTEYLQTLVYPLLFSSAHCGRKAVVACIAREYHQLGAKMVADILELNGWDSHFLGANTPVEELLSFLNEERPDLLALSLSVSANLPGFLEALGTVRQARPDIPTIVGGQAFRRIGRETLSAFPGVTLLESMQSLEEMVRRLS